MSEEEGRLEVEEQLGKLFAVHCGQSVSSVKSVKRGRGVYGFVVVVVVLVQERKEGCGWGEGERGSTKRTGRQRGSQVVK